MTGASRANVEASAARKAVAEADATIAEKAEMLMEIAMGLQQKPKSVEDLFEAVELYEDALKLCPKERPLLMARIRSRMATAQMIVPSEDLSFLEAARASIEAAL